MKKLFTLLFTFALFAILIAGSANAQVPVTVTNPGNTTPNLLATYPSLAAALTDLNLVTAMTGPVTLTLTGPNSETTPPTGLIIGSASLNPVLSATNSVLINTTGGTVTLNLISMAILAGISYGFVFSDNTGNNNSVLFSNLNYIPNVLNSQSPMLSTLIDPAGDGGFETWDYICSKWMDSIKFSQ